MRINRRQLLSLTVAVGVAGCSGSDENGGGTDQPSTETPTETPTQTPTETPTQTPTETPTQTPTETPTPEPAEFEVVGYEAPDRVEIDEEFVIRATVENTGGQPASFTAPLSVQTPDSSWEEGQEWDFGTIPPGESVTVESEEFSLNFINRYEFRIGQTSMTTVIQTVSASLNWGTEYKTPDGYVIRIDEPTLQDTYEYENYSGDIEDRAPEDGGQWAFVNIYVKNETGSTEFSPFAGDFPLVTGNTQYDSSILLDDPINKDQQFEGGELQPDIERSGFIVYAIDGGLSTGDFRIAYSKQSLGGEISVNWQTE